MVKQPRSIQFTFLFWICHEPESDPWCDPWNCWNWWIDINWLNDTWQCNLFNKKMIFILFSLNLLLKSIVSKTHKFFANFLNYYYHCIISNCRRESWRKWFCSLFFNLYFKYGFMLYTDCRWIISDFLDTLIFIWPIGNGYCLIVLWFTYFSE